MLTLAVLFVVIIIALAFVINSALDRREERRLKREAENRAASSDRGV